VAEIGVGATLEAAGPFPTVRAIVRAADLASLTALSPSVLYAGMIGIAADAPGTIYTWNGALWVVFASGGGSTLGLPKVRVASTANVTTLSGPQTVNGVALIAGQRIGLKNQTTSINNGVWVVNAGAWTRPTDFAVGFDASGFIFVATEGSVDPDTSWICTTNTAIVGTNNLAFTAMVAYSTATPSDVSQVVGSAGSGTLLARSNHTHFLSTAASFTWSGSQTFNGTFNFGSQILFLSGAGETVTLTRPFVKIGSTGSPNSVSTLTPVADGRVVTLLNVGVFPLILTGFGNIFGDAVAATIQPGKAGMFIYSSTAGFWYEINQPSTVLAAQEVVLSTLVATAIVSPNPGSAGNFQVNTYYRVTTAATDVTINVSWNDAAGLQTLALLPLTNQPVGSYTLPPVFVNNAVGQIIVEVTAGTINQVFASASVTRMG